MDLNAEMTFWTSLLGLTPENGWKVTWGWVDEIPHPDGGNAVGLNQTNGATKESHISIRRPRSVEEQNDLSDTCAHESVHCLGVRMQHLLDAGQEVEAQEYLAETLAPAMVKIKGTPKAKYLAKAARTLPARAKGTPMDAMKLLLALCQGLMGLANLPEEAKALIQPVLDEAQKGSGGDPGPPSAPAPAAKPPEAAPPAPPSNDAGMRDDELQKSPAYMKEMAVAVEAMVGARQDLTAEQKEYAKAQGTPAKVTAYLKTIPLAKPAEPPAPPTQLGGGNAPRGGAGNAGSAPSGDAKVNALFRIMPSEESDGVTFCDGKTDGKLVMFSVAGAFTKIKNATAKMVEDQKARMIRGAA